MYLQFMKNLLWRRVYFFTLSISQKSNFLKYVQRPYRRHPIFQNIKFKKKYPRVLRTIANDTQTMRTTKQLLFLIV